MSNCSPTLLGTLRALATVVACAGALTGCVSDTVKGASSGQGVTPIRSLAFVDSPSLDLGTVGAGSTNLIRLSISTTGSGSATVTTATNSDSEFAFNGGTFPGTGGTCAQPIQGNCSIAILFSPTSVGIYANVVTLAYTSGTTTGVITVTLSANVTLAPVLTINAGAAYDFGTRNVASSTDATLTVANAGGIGAASMAFSGLSAPLTFKGGTYPGTGGTCATFLASGASCTVVVTYAPIASGSTSQILTAAYTDGASASFSSTATITGAAVTLASLTFLTPVADPYDYGNVTVGATLDATYTIANGGGQTANSIALTGLSAPIDYKGGTYPGTGGSCGTTLAAAATCTVAITFSPTAAVLSTKTLDVAYADGSGSTVHLTKGLQGTGITPALLSISNGPTYDFGTRTIGSSTDGTLTVTNSGGSTATALAVSGLAAPILLKGGTFPGTGGTCTATLAAAATCTLVLTYSPTASVVTNRTMTLDYHDGAAATNTTRALTGTGGTAANLSLNAGADYGFGPRNVGTSTDATLTIANSGTLTATALSLTGLSAPILFAGGSYPGNTGTCSTTLAGGASCTIVLTFAPTSGGAFSKTLAVGYHNAVITTSTSQAITGTGVALASLSITSPVADPFDYGTVTIGASPVDQTFTVSNSGGQSATSLGATGLAAPFNFKGGAYPGTGGNCGATLAAAATCTIVATFLPTTPGLDSDSLAIAYNDGSGSTINLTHGVQGTGAAPAVLSISDGTTYDYGSRSVGSTTDHTFIVTNSVGASATSVAGAALLAPFSYKGGTFPGTGGTCTATITSGASCTVVISFAPTGTGGFPGTFTVNYDGGLGAQFVDRSLTGTGGAVANLTISDGATYNFGSVVTGYTLSKTFTVSNVGGASASSVAGAALAAPYTYQGGTFPGTGGNCGTTIGTGGSCTVVITYAPTAAVTSNLTFTLDYFDSVSSTSATRPMTGNGATITKISGGTSHTCALYSTGAVKCWGSNFYGQLGNATNNNSNTPVSVGGITTATDLASGAFHSCAMLSNGRIYCWGADNSGQLGDNAAIANSNTPVLVGLYTDFTTVAAGGDSSCGRRTGGTLVCWGNDVEGTNGNNAAFVNNATPVTVSGLTNMTDVSVGRGHACGRRSDNTFRCWGSDSYGQLGNGGVNTNSGIPVTPAPGVALSSSAGGDVSCSILSGGTVRCWGADDVGQLGDDVALASQISPVTVGGLANATSIKLGLKHGCALTAGAGIVCFGLDSSGQLGDDGAYTNQPTPVAVTGLAGVAAIGVGENHSCGILGTGLVYCWGQNTAGQLGDGTSSNQPTPVLVQGL